MSQNKSSKKWLTALLLGILVWPFGAMDFYAGKKKFGIIKLLTCGGGCGIWNLIDVVKLIMGKYTDAEGNVIAR